MQPPPLDDEELESHALFLRRLARRLVRDAPLAEDVAQETWRATLARPPAHVRAWRSWLSAAAKNVARQFARGAKRRESRERRAAAREALPSAADVAARLEAERRLLDAVAALEEGDRTLIVLRHFDGLAPREIAKRMGAPIETVKSRLKRALERLREQLVARGGNRERLHSGLLLIANGLAGKLGAVGGVLAGGAGLSLGTKLVASIAIAAAVIAGIRFGMAGSKGFEATRTTDPAIASAAATRGSSADGGDADRLATAARVSESAGAAPAAPAVADDPTAVSGRFVDESGHPLEGVLVCSDLAWGEWPPKRWRPGEATQTKSGADGRFVWRRARQVAAADGSAEFGAAAAWDCGWADALIVSFSAYRSGFIPVFFNLNGFVGKEVDSGDLVLQRAAKLAGSLAVPRDRDPASATIAVEDVNHGVIPAAPTLQPFDRAIMKTHPDASGHFELGGLSAGKFRLWTWMPGSLYAPLEIVTLAGEEERDDLALHVELPNESGESLEVLVERPDGSPQPDASVYVEFREGRHIAGVSFTADKDGGVEVPTYGFEVRRVRAYDPQNRLRPSTTPVGRRVENPCRLRLGATLPITIRVRSAGDEPIKGVHVRANLLPVPADAPSNDDENDETSVSGSSEESGPVELWMVDGTATLTVESRGFLDGSAGPFRVRDQHDPIDVVLTPVHGVTGRVLHEGRPLAGAIVSICSSWNRGAIVSGAPSRAFFTGFTSQSLTGADGRYRAPYGGNGRIFVRAHAQGFAAAEIGPFVLEENQTLDHVDLELTRGGTLSGTVLPGRDGASARFVVLSNGDGVPFSWPVGADGTFRCDHLTPSPWNVRAHDAPLSFRTRTCSNATIGELPSNCVVREGETTTLVISSDETLDCFIQGLVEGIGADEHEWIAAIGRDEIGTGELLAGQNPYLPRSVVADDGRFRLRWNAPIASKLVIGLTRREGFFNYWCAWSGRILAHQGIQSWQGRIHRGRIEGDIAGVAPGQQLAVTADATTEDGLSYEASAPLNAAGHFVLEAAPAGEVHLRCGAIEGSVTVKEGDTATVVLR